MSEQLGQYISMQNISKETARQILSTGITFLLVYGTMWAVNLQWLYGTWGRNKTDKYFIALHKSAWYKRYMASVNGTMIATTIITCFLFWFHQLNAMLAVSLIGFAASVILSNKQLKCFSCGHKFTRKHLTGHNAAAGGKPRAGEEYRLPKTCPHCNKVLLHIDRDSKDAAKTTAELRKENWWYNPTMENFKKDPYGLICELAAFSIGASLLLIFVVVLLSIIDK